MTKTIVAPEVCVITHEAHENVETWPRADDVLLVTELVDPIYATLLDLKLRVYAEFNLQEVWYVDAVRGTVAVHASPQDGEFQQVAEYRRGESWNSAALKGALVHATDAVGPER
ncbi:MAG TPA: Uma2 family endonuclease [Longimicrobium sp.]|nr:Uma2 family endonuclease [Longimicrobium sp.]